MDRGWVTTGALRNGEPVVRADGTTATVVGLRVVPGAANMWDLTVSNVHTFAVGAGAYVVHNCGTTGNGRIPGGRVPGDPNNLVPGQSNLYKGQAADPEQLINDGWQQDSSTSGAMHEKRFGQDFSAYLRSQGKSTLGWRYFMEEWSLGGGEQISNHYWSDLFENPGSPEFFHHH